jgi:GTP-binding protein Era
MNRQVKQALSEVDFIIMIADCRGWVREDEEVSKMVLASGVPAMMLLNKQDLIKNKKELLPLIASFAKKEHAFKEFVPFCARTGKDISVVLEQACLHLPERPFMFPKDQVTDRPERFLVAEIIREKIMHFLGDELPYTTSVVIDDFEELKDITNILATVWVERESQKPIVIGKKGSLLKRIASDSRIDIEKMLQSKVFLKVWVKTKKGWLDSSDALKTIGMMD